MANENVIQANFNGFYKVMTDPAWFIDHGMQLAISGIDLPAEFECHFSNSRSVAAKRQIGEDGVVTIPDEYFLSNAAQIFCWIYLHPTENSGVTEYEIVIPLRPRSNVDPAEPTQEQQDIVDQAIAALNVAMEATAADAESAAESADAAAGSANTAQAAADSVLGMTVSAETLSSGSDASVTKSIVDDSVHLSFGIPKGDTGATGETGPQGATGATPNFTIGTVQTLLPTQDATATITGTAEAPVLNLGIPKGAPGEVSEAELTAALENKADIIVSSASGSIASFVDGADDLPMKSAVVSMAPIQSGTGDPSPDNVRPISGRTGLNVYRTGKNLAPLGLTPTSTTGVTVSGISNGYKLTATSASIFLFARFDLYDASPFSGKKLTISGTSTADHTQNPQMRLRHIDANGVSVSDVVVSGSGSRTLSIPQNADGTISLYLYNTASATSGTGWETTWTNIMLELGESASTYVPHAGSTYAVDWTSEAGTVYGGTLDVVSGVLTVNRAIVDLGVLIWHKTTDSEFGTTRFWAANSTLIKSVSIGIYDVPNAICSIYQPRRNYGNSSLIQSGLDGFNVSNDTVRVVDSTKASLSEADFKAAMDGVQLVYELAAPLTYQLTPQEVKSLLGTNNVWSDSGDSSVTYRADTKLYIDNKISQAIAATLNS